MLMYEEEECIARLNSHTEEEVREDYGSSRLIKNVKFYVKNVLKFFLNTQNLMP